MRAAVVFLAFAPDSVDFFPGWRPLIGLEFMRTSKTRFRWPIPPLGLALLVLAGGCLGKPQRSETLARQQLNAVTTVYQSPNLSNSLPVLTESSHLEDFLQTAMFRQPAVAAAYFDWAASVERITVERSLADPRLTFQADVQSVIMALMPGLMVDLPGPGKLKARADQASAESRAKYYAFEVALLEAAFQVKKAYHQLHFLEAKLKVSQQTFRLLEDLEAVIRIQVEAGRRNLQDVLRIQIERDRLQNEIQNLEDAREPLRARFKASLGLHPEQTDPPVPARFESTPLNLDSAAILARSRKNNPRLKAMESEIHMAETAYVLARKGRIPDFGIGLEINPYVAPAVLSPQGSVTLPIWRDKIAAEIKGVQLRKSGAEARLSNEQIQLAVELAERQFEMRESERMVKLVTEQLLPKARESLSAAQTGYQSGRVDFLDLLDAQRTLLEFQMSAIDAQTRRELALAEVSLLLTGTFPEHAPILPPPPLKP
jgi:outer membrane protein TolC